MILFCLKEIVVLQNKYSCSSLMDTLLKNASVVNNFNSPFQNTGCIKM